MNVKYNIPTICLFCLFVALCNTFCNSKSDVFRQLEGVDHLFSEDKDSAAAAELEKISVTADSSAELALYNYLQAKMYARKNKTLPSNILDFSINYFEKTNDSLRLAYAYNYKSNFLLSENNKKYARIYNVSAERIAEHLNNYILNYNIYSIGFYIAAIRFKVYDFYVRAVTSDENIAWLQVAVSDAFARVVVDCVNNLLGNGEPHIIAW